MDTIGKIIGGALLLFIVLMPDLWFAWLTAIAVIVVPYWCFVYYSHKDDKEKANDTD